MKENRKKEAVAIVEAELEYHKNENDKMNEEMGIETSNPVVDCFVEEKEDHVFFAFDGAGYDYFSYHSPMDFARERLFEKLKKAGFHAEDQNNWSISIWED